MTFAWDDKACGMTNFIIELSIILLVFLILYYVFFRVIKRKSGYFFLTLSFVLILTTYILQLNTALNVILTVSFACLIMFFFSNIGTLRGFVAMPFKRGSGKHVKEKVEKIYDRHQVYQIIENTVKELSRKKIGALMTFERQNSLRDLIKNGVNVNAPVTSELLCTIFYPGTRLHDGAVIIHGNQIIAASVFFTPSTKAFAGKYGSRHRAAIGISEVSDSVTVVVSEETGRISIATNGLIESVTLESFLRVFENYMLDSPSDNY